MAKTLNRVAVTNLITKMAKSTYQQEFENNMVQRMEAIRQEQLRKIEENKHEQIKKIWVNTLLGALRANRDLKFYAQGIREAGLDFEECCALAIEQEKAELEKKRWDFMKSTFRKLIEEDYHFCFENMNLAAAKDSFNYDEDNIKKAFKEVQKEIYNKLYKAEIKNDESKTDDMERLIALGTSLGHNQIEIEENIAKERQKRLEQEQKEKQLLIEKEQKRAEEDFISKWKKLSWIIILICIIVEWFTLRWWILLLVPITIVVVRALCTTIAKHVYKYQHNKK